MRRRRPSSTPVTPRTAPQVPAVGKRAGRRRSQPQDPSLVATPSFAPGSGYLRGLAWSRSSWSISGLAGRIHLGDSGHVTRPELRSWHGLYRIWLDLRATQQVLPSAAQRLLGRAPSLGRRHAGLSPGEHPAARGRGRHGGLGAAPAQRSWAYLRRPSSRCTRSTWNRWPGSRSRRTPSRPCSIWGAMLVYSSFRPGKEDFVVLVGVGAIRVGSG